MRHEQSKYSTSRLILRLSLAFLVSFLIGVDGNGNNDGNGTVSGQENQIFTADMYFYLNASDAVGIVREFPASAPGTSEEDRPGFIYAAKPTGAVRVVEFYAHWCPHCQHFRKEYIARSEKIKQTASQNGIRIDFFGVSCVPHKKLCADQGIDSYPKLKVFKPGSTNGTFLHYAELHPFAILSMSGIEMDFDKEDYQNEKYMAAEADLPAQLRRKHLEAKNVTKESHFLPRTKKDIYDDAELSFLFTLQNSVYFNNKPLSNTTKDALIEVVETLHWILPPAWGLHALIKDLLDNFQAVVATEANLTAILARHPSKEKSWSYSCNRGSKAQGYTCGLWELFHIITVGVVEYNRLAIGDEWSYVYTVDVANLFRSFVSNFFTCEVCRLHFLSSFDDCAFDRCNRLTDEVGNLDTWKELPIWLWETHNAVNLRLMREKAEREGRTASKHEEIGVLWPSRSDCRRCWKSNGMWDQDNIWAYLRLTYWPDDSISEELRRMLFEGPDPEQIEDDDEVESYRFVPFLRSSLIFLIAVIAWTTYRQRLEYTRSGRHKKVDE